MAIARHFEFPEPVSSPYTESSLNDIEIVPYVEINGSRTLSDHFLGEILHRIIDDGLLSTVFGGIVFTNEDDFIRLMKSPANLPVFVFGGAECVGLAWLNGVGINHAYGHFCYFKNDQVSSMQFGKAVLNYWFSMPGTNGPFLDVIVGTIPSFNTKASHFVQKLGFKKLGEIPCLYKNPQTGELWASMIHYLVRPNG